MPVPMRITRRKLGWSAEYVSTVALGTMTFGVQNTEEEAHAQLDYYVKDCGGNLVDGKQHQLLMMCSTFCVCVCVCVCNHQIYGYHADKFCDFTTLAAEMYPTPASDPRWRPGATEVIIGNWLAKNRDIRDKVLIATKVSGHNLNRCEIESDNSVTNPYFKE